MNKSRLGYIAAALAIIITSTSCVGPYRLSNKVLSWNQSIGSKFVNEIVFLAFNIIPVYGVCLLADGLVFNSIEFWSGKPADVVAQEIKTEKGDFLIESIENGYKLTNTTTQDNMELVFEEVSKTWSVNIANDSYKLITFNDENNATVYINNEAVNVSLDEAGLALIQNATSNAIFYANK